jgi:Tat protein translocase TatB subunit
MFGIGPQELLIIALIALIAFGPEKLLNMARDLGRFTNEARHSVDEFKSELYSEEVKDARQEARRATRELRSEAASARRAAEELRTEAFSAGENRNGPSSDARPVAEGDEGRQQQKLRKEDEEPGSDFHEL